ncbi:hypothetical protein I656_02850 [Geobacillus sp. WSUCF1]|nr:hypothetical protein I656_02850 [Geobacillus sp. WSUCF1]
MILSCVLADANRHPFAADRWAATFTRLKRVSSFGTMIKVYTNKSKKKMQFWSCQGRGRRNEKSETNERVFGIDFRRVDGVSSKAAPPS